MDQVDAASLTSSLVDITDKLTLKWDYLAAQCYDGASVISGATQVSKHELGDNAPQAIHVTASVTLQTRFNSNIRREPFS